MMNDGLLLLIVMIGLLVVLDIASIFGVDSRHKDNQPNW
jgi:hypothetical protein